jgi:hypothetical protein
MSEPYTPAAVAPTFPLTLPLDGEIINHSILIDGIVKPALDYTASVIATATANMVLLAKQSASSGDTLIGVLTYAGSSLTLPTGTLRAALQYIADTASNAVALASQATGAAGTGLVGQRAVVDANQGTLSAGPLSTAIASLWQGKAGLSGVNAFTAANSFAATTTFTGSRVRSGADATDVERTLQVDSDFSTFTFATSRDTIWVDMADGLTADNQIWTATSTGAVLGSTVHVAAYNTTIGEHVRVRRDDVSEMCTLGGAGTGFATLKFLASDAHPSGRWRLVSGSGDVTITTPY